MTTINSMADLAASWRLQMEYWNGYSAELPPSENERADRGLGRLNAYLAGLNLIKDQRTDGDARILGRGLREYAKEMADARDRSDDPGFKRRRHYEYEQYTRMIAEADALEAKLR